MRRILWWIAGLLGAPGCTVGPDSTGASPAVWQVSAEPVLVIGADETRAGHQLYDVRSALRLADGRIVVVNGGSSEIRYYAQDGTYQMAVGGQGRGPMEFERIANVARAQGDTIVVLTGDPAVAWVADGRVVRKVPFNRAALRVPCRIDESPGILSDGSQLLHLEDNPGGAGCRPLASDFHQKTTLVARFAADTTPMDSIGVFPGTDRDGDRYALFGRRLAAAASLGRIFAGETGGDTVGVFSYDGEHLATLRVPLERAPIPESVRSWQPEPRRMPDGTVVPIAPYTIPERYPRFGRLLVDLAGNLWVMRYPASATPFGSYILEGIRGVRYLTAGAEWTVIAPDGAALATVRTPPGFHVYEIGEDYILGVGLNELDVQSVRMYALER
jgi:hypothetical protein